MKKRMNIWIPLLVALITLIGCGKKNSRTIEESQAGVAKRNVSVTQAVRKDIAVTINTSGRVEATNFINLNPSIPGKIVKIYLKEGDTVKEGDTILEFQDTQLIQAEQQYKNLEKNFQRSQELFQNNVIDLKTFEDISMGLEIAKANYEMVRENIVVKAPFDGKIGVIALKEGEFYTPMMQQSLIRIISPDRMSVKTYLSDKDYPKVRIGAAAIVRVDSYPGKLFSGKINFISPEADLVSGRFLCEVLVREQNNLLRHNQYANVTIELERSKNSIVIPKLALIENSFVYVVEDSLAKKREVKIGLANNDEVEILSGLSVDELIIITGNIGLVDNYPVNITE